MTLRLWQQNALRQHQAAVTDAYKRNAPTRWLLEACPGAGKTRFSGEVIRWMLDNRYVRRVIVRVPTAHLRVQWADAMRTYYGINLDCRSRKPSSWLRRPNCHGAVITYAQLARNPQQWIAPAQNALLINDEAHHAGEGAVWGDAMLIADQRAPHVLSLSGTPFRSDALAIPHVSYVKGVSQPDFSYGLADGLRDGVIRPISFLSYNGQITIESRHDAYALRLDDTSTRTSTYAERLAAALNPANGWLPKLLAAAHRMLLDVRRVHADAGGLIVCRDQAHARAVADCLAGITGETPVIVLSDTKTASRDIANFRDSAEKWLVSVRMVSEGIDIPRLRVGVFATNITTPMYFRQFIGRITRVTHDPPQPAYCYLPADSRLVALAQEILQQQRHIIPATRFDRDDEIEADVTGPEEAAETGDSPESQEPSVDPLDAPIVSATSRLDGIYINGIVQPSLFPQMVAPTAAAIRDAIDTRVVEMREDGRIGTPTVNRVQQRSEMQKEIKRLVGRLVRQSGRPHAHIYQQLNNLQRVRSQDSCSDQQLAERISWLERKIA